MPNEESQGSQYLNPKQNPAWADRWQGPELVKYKDMVYKKISELLLAQWSRIEPFIDGNGFESLQKTYKDGKLITGKNATDLLVVYESDIDANGDDGKIEDALLTWLEFVDVNQITLDIVTTAELNEEGNPSPPNLILKFPNKSDFNLNEIIGTPELKDINLKDNVSQFMNLNKKITNINRTKLSEYVDTEFSELSPTTFTQFLENYMKYKKRIPLRYRSDDFFDEYSNSNLPMSYRIQKLFEEFERIKNNIPGGGLTPVNEIKPTLDDLTIEELWKWPSLTYLIAQSQQTIGSTNIMGYTSDGTDLIGYSQLDALSWWNTINQLNVDSGSLVVGNETKQQIINDLEAQLAALGDTLVEESDLASVNGCTDPAAINYNYSATVNDGSCEYDLEDGYVEGAEPIYGCTDPDALNHNENATDDDYSCQYAGAGCMDTTALNYDVVRAPEFDYCMSPTGFVSNTECKSNSECSAHGADWTCNGSCEYTETIETLSGCTVPEAWNYNAFATKDDGSCTCFGTQKYKDLPDPYGVTCQPGFDPADIGTPNYNTCECDYADITMTWSKKSSDCRNYSGFLDSSAECYCVCESSSPLVDDLSWNNLGDCSVAFEDDETNCASKCNTKCAEQETTKSGKPVCESGTEWNGTFCQSTMRAGGAIPVSKAINTGPSSEINTDISIPIQDFSIGNGTNPFKNPSKQLRVGGKVGGKTKGGITQYKNGGRPTTRRTINQFTSPKIWNGLVDNSVEISFESAKTEVDDMGNTIGILKPYNIPSMVSKIKTDYQQKTGKPIHEKHLKEITDILEMSEGFIGAHYHTLNEWARDNMDIVIPALGLRRGADGQVMFPDCTGSCSSSGLGSCSSVCVGSICETVPGVTDHGSGNTIVPSSKTYGISIRIAL